MPHHNFDPSLIDLWRPDILLLTLFIACMYWMLIGPWRHRFSESSEVSILQKILFLLGLFIFYIAIGSPLNYIGHVYLFSAHMIQQALLYLAVPPLILLGTPAWFIRALLRVRVIAHVWRAFTQPLIAVVLFNVLFSFYHIPFIFDFLYVEEGWQAVAHVLLTFTAFAMWWNVTCPVPELNRLSELQKLGYIFASGVLITPACALMIFADKMMYESYMNVPQILMFLSSADDQQSGGVIMKVMQEIIYGSALLYIFVQWFKKDRENEVSDGLNVSDMSARARYILSTRSSGDQ